MKPAWWVPLLLLTLTPGCHVVDRAKSCGKLAAIAKKAAPELTATKIPDSPSPEVLRKKAELYSQLAEALAAPAFNDQAVRTAREGLIGGLTNLSQHLLDAAQAVEAHAELIKRQKRAAARHEKILAEKLKHGEKSGPAQAHASPEVAPPQVAPSQGAASQIGAGKPLSNPTGPRLPGLAGFEMRPRSGVPAGTPSPVPPGAQVSQHTYRYERAKRAAEVATRNVESSIRTLETACR
jgi:hypothetical protein